MKNVAAFVRARLLNLARETEVPLAALMERFALGRLLWRLSRSASAGSRTQYLCAVGHDDAEGSASGAHARICK